MIHDDRYFPGFKPTDLANMATTTTTLPPVRTPNYLPQALTPSVSEETISLWLKLGAMEKLEQAVLDGHGDLLCGRTSRLPQVNKFLRQVPLFQNKIQEIHQAVASGKIREVQHLIDRKKLAFCRDQAGASPLHKAVIFGHKDIIQYLLERYSAVLHIRDHQGRTPLHYAAFLSDGGEIYQLLIDAGADTKATDVFGKHPDYYVKIRDETTLQELRDGYTNSDIRKIKQKKQPQNPKLQKGYSRQALGRVQIKELISKGDLEALEEIVLHGYGGLLLGETSANTTIQDFLNKVPFYLKRIHDIHRAAVRGRLQEVIRLLDHKSFAIAMDQLGATALHKAVWYGNYDVAEHIANSFPVTVNVPDLDGRTPLHYAAVLRDDKEIYNMLVNAGANRSVQDNKGKTPEYYAQHMELLKLEDVIRRNQRINATNMANIINHTRSKLPLRGTPPSVGKDGFSSSSTSDISGQELDDEIHDLRNNDEKYDDYMHYNYNTMDAKTESLIKSLPPLPPVKLQRLEISSATVRKWIQDEDMENLKQAVVEGYGDMMMKESSESEKMQEYLSNTVPMMLEKIHNIHGAVSHDDLLELQTRLDGDELVAAKDSLGRTPLHKAVILSHTKIVKFLCYNFPEILNITDKEGRTALHYAAAGTRKENLNIYKVLLQTGADPKIRDMQGKTADYYRTHRMSTSYKLPPKPKATPSILQNQLPDSTSHFTKQGVLEKITSALQKCDIEMLKTIVLEGNGKYLIGKTSWNDEVRQYLRTIPYYLSTIRSLQEAVAAGDVSTTEKRLSEDESLLRSKDDTGATPLHLAVSHKQPEIVKFLASKYPSALNLKDNASRTALILAAQEGETELYNIMVEAGADTMILDQKGRSAEYYLSEMEKDEKSPHQLTSSVEDKITENNDKQEQPENDADDTTINEEKPSEEAVLNDNTEYPTSEQINDLTKENENESDISQATIEKEVDIDKAESESTCNANEDEVIESQKEVIQDVENEKEQSEKPKENAEDTSVEDKNDVSVEQKNEDVSVEGKNEDISAEEKNEDISTEEKNEDVSVEEKNEQSSNLNYEKMEDSNQENSKREDDNTAPEETDKNLEQETSNETAEEAVTMTAESEKKTDTESEEQYDGEINSTVESESQAAKETNADNIEQTVTESDNMENDATEKDIADKERVTEESEQESVSATNVEEPDTIENSTTESNKDNICNDIEENANMMENPNQEVITENKEESEAEEKKCEAEKDSEVEEKKSDSDENSKPPPETEGAEISEEPQDTVPNSNSEDSSKEVNDDEVINKSANMEETAPDTDYEAQEGTEIIQKPVTDEEAQSNDNQGNNSQTENANDEKENVSNIGTENPNTDNSVPAETENASMYSSITEQSNKEINSANPENDNNDQKGEYNTVEETEQSNNEPAENDTLTTSKAKMAEEIADSPKKVPENNQRARSNNRDTNNLNNSYKNSSGSKIRKPSSRTSQSKDYLDELIEQWIKDGDLLRLEHVVLAGQGDRLTEKTSEDKQVQDFLDLVPIYTAKIRAIHEAIIRGNLQEVRAVLTRKRFALSRDHVGASPLHLAVLHGHYDVIQYIITHFPETMNGPDNEGRTPLHYAAVIPDEGYLYTMLRHAGADENIKDKMGYTPRQYFENEGQLTVRDLWDAYKTGEDP